MPKVVAGLRVFLIVVAVILAALIGRLPTAQAQAPYNANLYSGLKWRMLGPFRGGRVDAVSGVPGRPNEFYFGAVNGGVWKTIDAGRVWFPVFDAQPVASIGALAVAPSTPDTIYVGTGESTLRDSMGYGNGMYKSTDAGKTWTHVGLDDTQHIGRIAVDPKNANVVFVAVIGHLYEPHAERGVFKTTDGGRSWKKILYKNENVGAVDVVIDPVNTQTVYVSLWNTRRPPWYTYQPSNGPGGGVFKSTDGGATWKQLANGLPTECVGRAGIALAAANPRRVYAVVDDFLPEGAAPDTPCPGAPPARGGGAGTAAQVPPVSQQGGFYRSDDGGATWTKLSGDAALWGRGWYFEHVTVDPTDADVVYVSNVALSRSTDGGRTWVVLRGSPGGDDYQGVWVSPDDTNTIVVASDQGTVITRNAKTLDPREVTWSSWLNQPTAQLYHLSVDYRMPYWVTGAQQDSGAVAVRSRGKFAVLTMRDWEPIGAGGESGMTAGDPLHPGIIFGQTGTRYNLDLNLALSTAQPVSPETARTDWTQPLVFSKADPHALYYANQFLFKTIDGAKTWAQISPDLTRPNPGVPPTLDATSAEDTDRNGKRGVIYTVAPSPLDANLVWIGTDDGLIQVTGDGGKSWQDVTPSSITAWSRLTTIEASHVDRNAAYATVDRHQLGDFNPYVYRTRDMGKTWQPIARGLPPGVYVHVVREDPMRRGLLFAGTERGVWVSFDDGGAWQTLQLNLPSTSMRDFEIYGNDLIVATHGRGFWVIDDVSPLRQIDDAVAADAHLFKPADAISWGQGSDNGTPTQKDEPQAPNAPNGASIDYYLKNGATGPISIEILGANGSCVAGFASDPAAIPGCPAPGTGQRGFRGRGGATQGIPNVSPLWQSSPEPFATSTGMHRITWNPSGGGGRGFGGRGAAPTGPTSGTFTARLTVNGRTYTQTFTIKPDPRGRE